MIRFGPLVFYMRCFVFFLFRVGIYLYFKAQMIYPPLGDVFPANVCLDIFSDFTAVVLLYSSSEHNNVPGL